MKLHTTDMKDAAIPLTVGVLRQMMAGKPDDWKVEIRLCGDRVILLDVDEEDVTFEQGKLMLITGANGPFEMKELDVSDLGLTKQQVEDMMRDQVPETPMDLSDEALPKFDEEEDGS